MPKSSFQSSPDNFVTFHPLVEVAMSSALTGPPPRAPSNRIRNRKSTKFQTDYLRSARYTLTLAMRYSKDFQGFHRSELTARVGTSYVFTIAWRQEYEAPRIFRPFRAVSTVPTKDSDDHAPSGKSTLGRSMKHCRPGELCMPGWQHLAGA